MRGGGNLLDCFISESALGAVSIEKELLRDWAKIRVGSHFFGRRVQNDRAPFSKRYRKRRPPEISGSLQTLAKGFASLHARKYKTYMQLSYVKGQNVKRKVARRF